MKDSLVAALVDSGQIINLWSDGYWFKQIFFVIFTYFLKDDVLCFFTFFPLLLSVHFFNMLTVCKVKKYNIRSILNGMEVHKVHLQASLAHL